MKHSTKLLLILLLLLQIPTFAQITGDYRSKASGNWGDFSTWQIFNGSSWVDATAGQIPSGSNESNASNVYIEAGHTVLLNANQGCKDLNLNTNSDVVRINTQNFVLNVWGKMRFYTGAAPGAVSSSPAILGWISTGANGYIRFRGTVDRIIMVQGQVNANNNNSGWNLDFAFDPGVTGQINDRIRAGNITVSSGILFVNNPTGELRVGTNNGGTTDFTINGRFLVKSGATVKGGAGIFKKSDVACEDITVESGANLIITRSPYVLAAANLQLNGNVILQNAITFPSESGRSGAALVNNFNNLSIEGTGAKTLNYDVNVSGKLTIKETASFASGSYSVHYGSTGELEFNGSAAQVSTNTEFPASSGPASLIINNSNGVSLHASRTISNQLTLSSGLLYIGNNDLTLGANSPAVSGTLSENAMVVTNGSGKLNKIFSSAGVYVYPIGDTTGTDEFSPAQITVNSASAFNNSTYFGTRVLDKAHASTVGATDYLSRYWEASTNMSGYSYNANFQYLAEDVNGTESNINSYLFADETSGSNRKAIDAVNSSSHQIQFTNQKESGFIGGANFGCNITNNIINTANTSICSSKSLLIDASAASVLSGTPVYQWQNSKNGGAWTNILVNGNNEDYTHPDTLGIGVYNYRRLVSDPVNCIASNYNISNEVVISFAGITSNPTDVNACFSSNASFTASTIGQNLTYYWQYSHNGGAGFYTVTNNSIYSNATTTTLNITNPPLSINNYLYRLAVVGSCGTIYTTPAKLIVTGITSQPVSKSICQGANTLFSVTTNNTGVTYQWQGSTDGGSTFNNLSNNATYSNVTTATLNITAAAYSLNSTIYRCIINGACGSPMISNNATLTINSAITSNPLDANTCLNSNASFNASATGSNLTYQWQYSHNGGVGFYTITNNSIYTNATTNTLNITNAPLSINNYLYRLAVTGACGTIYSTPAKLTVSGITSQPVSKVICQGANTSFSVTTNNPLTYQWQGSTDGGSTFNNLSNDAIYSNVTTATLNITAAVYSMNSTIYRCIINGACGSPIISGSATLTINTAITSNPIDASSCTISNTSFTASATGSNLSYYWQYSHNGGIGFYTVTNNSIYSNATTTTLNITNPPLYINNYLYRLVVTGACGTIYSTPAKLTVNSVCGAKIALFEEEQEDDQLVISGYPNPFTETIAINSRGFKNDVTVTMRTIDGRVVFVKENHSPEKELVIGGELESGFYIIELRSDKEYGMIKVFKSK